MIALIDYGAGNLTSVRKAFSTLGADVIIPQEPTDLDSARAVIVPGVGNFDATRALNGSWHTAVRAALDRGASLFGICLGMQWLFNGSDEAPDVPGFGVISGRCVRLGAIPRIPTSPTSPKVKIPHVGWNSLEQPYESALMHGVPAQAQVYFTHSYIAPVVPETVAVTTYCTPFSSAVQRGRIAGVQFHPEKSGEVGLRILKNWLESCS